MENLVSRSPANRGFWRGRRVLITGHTGFKGSWLALWLEDMGAEVSGFSLPPESEPSLFEIVHRGMARSTFGDVRDLPAVQSAMTKANPEVVFHLAAQPLVRKSYREPVATYATNVMGTVHVLEAARTMSELKAIVVVTSDKSYENREWPWGYRECDPMGGHDPYSSSKGCAELVTAAYRDSFFKSKTNSSAPAVATARAGNVIGGGDWAEDRLIPDLLQAFSNGKTAYVRNPQSIRPWQHVLESLAGYLKLAEKLSAERDPWTGAWNFGPIDGDAMPVSWIADQMACYWGHAANWRSDDEPHPHEANWLKLDSSKARQILGWSPLWTLSKTLQSIADWHKLYRDGADMRWVTLEQIHEYESCYRTV